ncbi:MAG: aminopeptidase P family N-terminal domain-containing protein, partial [Pseudomonadota bacterium]
MTVSKRSFLKLGGAALAASAAPAAFAAMRDEGGVLPSVANAKPIGRDERLARIAKAQKLMQEQGVSFLLLEPGAALTYFTGLRWWRSERLVAALIPREGEVGVVTPYFEEPSVQESLGVPASVRT